MRKNFIEWLNEEVKKGKVTVVVGDAGSLPGAGIMTPLPDESPDEDDDGISLNEPEDDDDIELADDDDDEEVPEIPELPKLELPKIIGPDLNDLEKLWKPLPNKKKPAKRKKK